MAEEQPDPVTLVYRAIRNALMAWEPWAEVSLGPPNARRVANFPDYSGSVGTRVGTSPVDLANIALLAGAFSMRPGGRNSLLVSVDQAFPLIVSNDAKVTLAKVNRIKWEAFRALVNAGDNLGLPFVRSWEITEGRDTAVGPDPQSGAVPRFVTALTVNTQLDVPRKFYLVP